MTASRQLPSARILRFAAAPCICSIPGALFGGATSAGRGSLDLNGRSPRGFVQMRMRLIPLLVTATLAAAPAFAQQADRPSKPAEPSSPQATDRQQSTGENRESTGKSQQSSVDG